MKMFKKYKNLKTKIIKQKKIQKKGIYETHFLYFLYKTIVLYFFIKKFVYIFL